jgi:antitoxin (DNA-binding transcriptional repressor) of toxin-antitoxin stability system
MAGAEAGAEAKAGTEAGAGAGAGAGRVAVVAVLLLVAATGLRARGTFARGPNQAAAGATAATATIVLSAAEVLAFIAFLVVLASARPQRKKKRDEDEEPWRPVIPWWAKTLGVLLAVAALVTPLAVLLTRKPRQLATRPLPGILKPGLAHPAAQANSATWPLITGMVIAIMIVLTLTVLSRRRRPADISKQGRRRLATLLDSLAAGREALTAGGEPRAAIIACYAAMERGFAAAGSAPAVADTPAEVLARATRAGLVRPEPAEALTGLFRRARYSTQLMTSGDATAAADALTQMRADLASQEPET